MAANRGDMPTFSPETRLAFTYAPVACRAGIVALFTLDDALASIVRSTREPMVGQMRLTWWYEALVALDGGRPPAEPTLQAIHNLVLPYGVRGSALAAMTDGWEALLADPLDDAAITLFAAQRGGRLFGAAAALLGADADPDVATAGEGWALADFARRLTDAAAAARVAAQARGSLDRALSRRWPRDLRMLGALALSARYDVMVPRVGGPRRVGRLMLHRLTGF